MAEQKEHRVGIYARLSKEDQRAGESVSIENQVMMLVAHVKNQGWELAKIYQDDAVIMGLTRKIPKSRRFSKGWSYFILS